MELFGVALAIVGLVFAFERPRTAFLKVIHRRPDVEHFFAVRIVFHAHNDGKELGAFGTNKTDKKFELCWSIKNNVAQTLQIERGIRMRGAASGGGPITLTPPAFTSESQIMSGHTIELMTVALTSDEVDHYRHWVREADAFGVRLNGQDYWIPVQPFTKFALDLQIAAKEFGLAETVPQGKLIAIEINRKV